MTDTVFGPIENVPRDVVVVGVRNSACGRGAIVFAADEAYRRGARLHLVQVRPDAERDCSEVDLESLATMVRAEYPWLPVQVRAADAVTERRLLEDSAEATLLVLGTEEDSAEHRAMVRAASCPVVEVRHRTGQPQP